MKNILFVLIISLGFVVSTASMQKNQENVSLFLEDQFKKSCYNKTGVCNHVFITPKFRIEHKTVNNQEILETNINFKKEYWGKLRNNLHDDHSMRGYILNLIELTKSSGKSFGDVVLDQRTFCSGPIYIANGDRGTIKCQTFLGKK